MAKRDLHTTLDRLADELVDEVLSAVARAIRSEGPARLGIHSKRPAKATERAAPARLRTKPAKAKAEKTGRAKASEANRERPKKKGAKTGRPKASAKARTASPRARVDSVPPASSSFPHEAVIDPEALLGALGLAGDGRSSDALSGNATEGEPLRAPKAKKIRSRPRASSLLGDGTSNPKKRASAPPAPALDAAPPAAAARAPESQPTLRQDEVAVRSRGGNIVIKRNRPVEEPVG